MTRLTSAALVLCALSCYYDNEEELYPSDGCDLSEVTYSNTVLPILESRCFECHDAANNLGNVTLEGYNNVKTYVDNGKLLGVIRWESGFPRMPMDRPQLPDCTIMKIETWVEDGAPNN